jgi:drug/metabolite transporter (DMT)-like permease
LPNKKALQRNFSKSKSKKLLLDELPKKTMMVTVIALKWVFLLIFIFIMVGIFALFLAGSQNHIQTIITYSITGFFTFFMGYFGWILAQGVIETISGKDQDAVKGVSYYLGKRKKHKH